eukprot:Gb_13753 [translate_table: standard]
MKSSRRGKPAYDGVNCGIRCRIASVFKVLMILLLLVSIGSCERRKGFRQHLEKFFCSVDQDGDGEIEQHEATKFLSSIGAKLDLAEESKDDSSGGKDAMHDFISPHNFKGNFSYGGATISAEEMLDHLQNMLTADRVVDWITHGLQLPMYAQAFQENAVNGLDFPALIEDHSQTLLYELRVQSLLHRKKITHAIVRQVFGLGAVPGLPANPWCTTARCGAIQLQWDSPSFHGYPPLHKYLIQKRFDNASSWIPIGDSKENSFLDKDGIHLGKIYNYRIQAWGDHGPSEWVEIDDCHTSDIDEHCELEPAMHTAGMAPFIEVDASTEGRRISIMDSHERKVVIRRFAGWGWMYSVNGFLLILGIISRQSLFFRIILAIWFLFRAKILDPMYTSLTQAQNSQYLLGRIISRTFLTLLSFWQFMQAKVWDLSRQVNGAYPGTYLVNPCFPSGRKLVTENEGFNDTDAFPGTDCRVEDMQDAFPSRVFSGKQQSALDIDTMQSTNILLVNGNQYFDGPVNSLFLVDECAHAGHPETAVETIPDSRSEHVAQEKSIKRITSAGTIDDRKHLSFSELSSKNSKTRSCSAPIERVNKCSELSPETMHEGDSRKGKLSTMLSRNRNRCNFEGCKARFDRWHCLSDWRMKFQKHYCRDCQCVFCVNHTRISPHGPLGQCGLESNCVCQACFERLPSEARQKLEQINKLRVGPYASVNSFFHEKRTSRLENASTRTRNDKFELYRMDAMREGKTGSCPHDNDAKDPYPANLGMACSSNSSDSSLSDSSHFTGASSSYARKIMSISCEDGHGNSITSTQHFDSQKRFYR